MSKFNCIKNKKLWFAISALIIVAGLVCSFIFGGFDIDFSGYERYAAAFSEGFDPEAVDAGALVNLASETAGADFSAKIVSSYTGSGYSLELVSKTGAQTDLAGVKAKINESYPEAALGDFETYKIAPSKNTASALVVLGCFALAWLAAWAAAVFAVGVSDSVLVLLAAVHDTLIASAVCVIARAGSVRVVIACGLLAAALSTYFNIIKLNTISSFATSKRSDKEGAVIAAGEALGARSFSFAAFAAVFAAGVVIASLCMGESAAIPFAVCALFALIAGVYSSACITPNLWSMKKQ